MWIIIAVILGIIIIGVVFFLTGGQETLQTGIKENASAKNKGVIPMMLGGSYNNQNYKELTKAFKSLNMNMMLKK